MRIRSVLTLCALLCAAAVSGQAEMAIPTAPAEMKQWDFLVGTWKGAGTFLGMGSELPFTTAMTARRAVEGHYLLIEEKVSAVMPGATEASVVHEGLVLVSYDAAAKVFRSKAYETGGIVREAEVKPGEGGKLVETDKPSPFSGMGQARFTFGPTGPDSWETLAEQSDDGATWTKVFDCKYTRASAK